MANLNDIGIEHGKTDLFYCWPEDLVLVDQPEHPLFDTRSRTPPTATMTADVERRGIKVPILARKEGGTLCVIDGRKRTLAARLVNEGRSKATRIKVPVKIERGEVPDLVEAMIALNEHREEDDPINRARKAQRLRDLGRNDREIAVTFGVSVEAVRQWDKLLSAAPEVVRAVETRELPAHLAANLSALPMAEQVGALAGMRESGELRGSAAVTRVARATGKSAARKAKRSLRPIREVEARLVDGEFMDQLSVARREAWCEALRWVLGE